MNSEADSVMISRTGSLRSTPAKLQLTLNIPLNDKQRLFRDIVHDYAKRWHYATYEKGVWPKPLRLFLGGDPGAGKSTATKVAM